MNKKISNEIRQGLLTSRLSEKQLDRSIKKIQKNEKKLLFDIKKMLDSNNSNEARLMAKELLESRRTIKELGKLKFFVRGIQLFFKNAQSTALQGEAAEVMAQTLIKVNKMLSPETLERTFLAIETEVEKLDLTIGQAIDSLDSLDNSENESNEFVDVVISELQAAPKEKLSVTINDLVSLDRLLPALPTSLASEDGEDEEITE